MPRIAVGQADHLYFVARQAVKGGCPARMKVGIIRMRANNEKTERMIGHLKILWIRHDACLEAGLSQRFGFGSSISWPARVVR